MGIGTDIPAEAETIIQSQQNKGLKSNFGLGLKNKRRIITFIEHM